MRSLKAVVFSLVMLGVAIPFLFAQTGARVVLISCDLRRPGLSRLFAPDGQAELSAVLAGTRRLDEAISPVYSETFRVRVKGSSTPLANSVQRLSNGRSFCGSRQ